MVEFLLGVIASPFFYAIACFILMILEAQKDPSRGFISFVFVSVLGCAIYSHLDYLLANIVMVISITVAYLLAGCTWTVYLWSKHCRSVVEKFKGYMSDPINSPHTGMSLQYQIDPERYLSRFVYWVFLWPISVASSFVDDVLGLFKRILSKAFIKISKSSFEEMESIRKLSKEGSGNGNGKG